MRSKGERDSQVEDMPEVTADVLGEDCKDHSAGRSLKPEGVHSVLLKKSCEQPASLQNGQPDRGCGSDEGGLSPATCNNDMYSRWDVHLRLHEGLPLHAFFSPEACKFSQCGSSRRRNDLQDSRGQK
jgi:hypothetical protein